MRKLLPIIVMFSLVLTGCATTVPTPAQETEYTEVNFLLYKGDTYRYNFFLNQGESFNCYWKASDSLQCWYTNSYGQAKLEDEPEKEIQMDPNIGRVRLWEPGKIPYQSWMAEGGWDITNMRENYGFILEFEDHEGNFIEIETLDGGRAGDMQIEADRTGYYTLCFYIYFHDTESVDVVLRYRLEN